MSGNMHTLSGFKSCLTNFSITPLSVPEVQQQIHINKFEINLAARLAQNLQDNDGRAQSSVDGSTAGGSSSSNQERNDRLRRKVRTIARMASAISIFFVSC